MAFAPGAIPLYVIRIETEILDRGALSGLLDRLPW
jgi:hypothetical protein